MLEMGSEVVGEGGADGGVGTVRFLIGINVDDGKGGGGGKGEDEGVKATMRGRFVRGMMMREDGILAKKGHEGRCKERDIVGSSGLGAEQDMLRGGRVRERRVGFL